MTVEGLLDRVAGKSISEALAGSQKAAQGAAQAAASGAAGLDRLAIAAGREVLGKAEAAGAVAMPALSLADRLDSWIQSAATHTGIGRLVWGDATPERGILNRARASVMRAQVAIDGKGKELASISSDGVDQVMSSIASRAVSEVPGAEKLDLAVAAIGNYGRRQVGPFSGLDFAVLTGKGDPASRALATQVARRMVNHLKALGGTSVLQPGLRAGAYLSPAGTFGKTLVGTPADLARTAVSSDLPALARWDLHDLRPVYQNTGSDLANAFHGELDAALATAKAGGLTGTTGLSEARAMLVEAVGERTDRISGEFDPAKSIERPLSLAIRSMAVKHGVAGSTTAQRVENLAAKGAIPSDLRDAVLEASTWSGNAKVARQIAQGQQAGAIPLDATSAPELRRHLSTLNRFLAFAAGH